MVSRQIIQFKCVVSLCDQDFGAFCRERGLEKKNLFEEQPGATKQVPGCELGALVEEPGMVGWVGGLLLDVLAMLGTWVCPWMAVTLWDRLWWAWAAGPLGQDSGPGAHGRMIGRNDAGLPRRATVRLQN